MGGGVPMSIIIRNGNVALSNFLVAKDKKGLCHRVDLRGPHTCKGQETTKSTSGYGPLLSDSAYNRVIKGWVCDALSMRHCS